MKTNEALNKSLDEMIDDLFAQDTIAKSDEMPSMSMDEKEDAYDSDKKSKGEMDEENKIAAMAPRKMDEKDANRMSPLLADENGAAEEEKETEDDEVAGMKRGRSEDLSAWSKRSKDGESMGSYDASITHPAMNVPNETTVAKSTFEISKEDFEILKKAKTQKVEEELRKAKKEQTTLIKSAIFDATSALRKENEQLRKSFQETQELIKSMARKPQPRKSVAGVQVLEKSFEGQEAAQSNTFSKSEMLDVAEALVKSKQLSVEDVIELEDTGYIYNPASRAKLEIALKGKR